MSLFDCVTIVTYPGLWKSCASAVTPAARALPSGIAAPDERHRPVAKNAPRVRCCRASARRLPGLSALPRRRGRPDAARASGVSGGSRPFAGSTMSDVRRFGRAPPASVHPVFLPVVVHGPRIDFRVGFDALLKTASASSSV